MMLTSQQNVSQFTKEIDILKIYSYQQASLIICTSLPTVAELGILHRGPAIFNEEIAIIKL